MTEQTEQVGIPLQLEDEQSFETEQTAELNTDDPPVTEEQVKKQQKAAAQAASMLSLGLPEAKHEGAPLWVSVPVGFKFPRGKQVLFLRFKSIWTDTPWKGEPIVDPATGVHEVDGNGKPVLYRHCICWPVNTADKKLALGRAQRDPNRAPDELAKQMVRVHDGFEADWAVARQNGVEMFWNELGERCRTLLVRVFTQLHVLDTDSTRDFLANCIEVRSTGS
jgi:hypothetical protein